MWVHTAELTWIFPRRSGHAASFFKELVGQVIGLKAPRLNAGKRLLP